MCVRIHTHRNTCKHTHKRLKLQSFYLSVSIDDIPHSTHAFFGSALCATDIMLSANMNAIQLSSHCVRRQYKLNCVRFHININVNNNVH